MCRRQGCVFFCLKSSWRRFFRKESNIHTGLKITEWSLICNLEFFVSLFCVVLCLFLQNLVYKRYWKCSCLSHEESKHSNSCLFKNTIYFEHWMRPLNVVQTCSLIILLQFICTRKQKWGCRPTLLFFSFTWFFNDLVSQPCDLFHDFFQHSYCLHLVMLWLLI